MTTVREITERDAEQRVYCRSCRSYSTSTPIRRSEPSGRYLTFQCGFCEREITVESKMTEAREKVRARQERMGKFPRTQAGRRYSPGPEVRAAWQEVRRAKRADSFLRRAQAWANLVWIEALDAGDDEWTERWRATDAGVVIHRGRSRYSPPTIRRKRLNGMRGQWRRAIGHGHTITIDDREKDLDQARRTLVHEMMHALDGIAEVECARGSDHGPLFYQRLAILERSFNPTGRAS